MLSKARLGEVEVVAEKSDLLVDWATAPDKRKLVNAAAIPQPNSACLPVVPNIQRALVENLTLSAWRVRSSLVGLVSEGVVELQGVLE